MSTTKIWGKHDTYLGRYRAMRLLGQGGMGKVFLGLHLDQNRQVVIKVMHPDIAGNPRFRQNFAREMRLMMRFSHPHAVALLDASLDETPLPCIVMEYVDGITLEELIKRHARLPVLRVGRLLAQLCQVLQAAHDLGILHRDLSTTNIMVEHPDTPHESLKVLDFGLSRMGAAPFISLEKLNGTATSIGGGTPDFMCPEQIRCEEVDHRGDIYSVGVILFKLLAGCLPFQTNSNLAEILLAHVETKPLTFAEAGVLTGVPARVEEVVQSCLEKFPGDRPQCARDLAQQFERALGCKFYSEVEATPSNADINLDVDPRKLNPQELMDCLEAWMPEQIAVVKLRGFVGDLGGEVVESEPGFIRVCLPGPSGWVSPPKGLFGWLGLGSRGSVLSRVMMDLHMEKKPACGGRNQLQIAVAVRPEKEEQLATHPEWRPWCQRLCRDLRAYLISR